MKNLTIPLSFILGLSAVPVETALAAAANNPPASPEQTVLTPEAALAAQVAEIAATTTLTRDVQESLISSAVRLAILTATEGVRDPAQVLKLALQLTTAAAKAAPRFSDTILKTAAALPTLASIPGGPNQIQAAVLDAVMAAVPLH